MSENETVIPAAEPVKQKQPVRNLQRIRLTYARGEATRYVSNLDLLLVWERTLRRAGVALAYSQGFSQHPRLHMACALPLGFLSRCELMDFWLVLPPQETAATQVVVGHQEVVLQEVAASQAAAVDIESIVAQIQAAAPPGLTIVHAQVVPLNLPALQTQVQSSEFAAVPLDALDEAQLSAAVAKLLAAASLPRERRRGKGQVTAYDLRPLVEALEIRAGPTLFMRLSAREGATGRPEEVLAALGYAAVDFRVERTKLILA